MKILLFGNNGMVGRAVKQLANQQGLSIESYNRQQADFTNPQQCTDIVMTCDSDVIINAAAYTAVDKAETEPELAYAINCNTPGAIAIAANHRSIPLVHISTDYIFSSNDETPMKPDHPTGPVNIYGASKLAGEKAIVQSGCKHTILRTSWVFSDQGNNFVKTMLRLSEEKEALSIVSDQVGGPTCAYAIADACIKIAKAMHMGSEGGMYHFSGTPNVSWSDFARCIFERAKRQVQITDITTSEYKTPAARPLNSRLNCDSLLTDFKIKQPNWKDDLDHIIKGVIPS